MRPSTDPLVRRSSTEKSEWERAGTPGFLSHGTSFGRPQRLRVVHIIRGTAPTLPD